MKRALTVIIALIVVTSVSAQNINVDIDATSGVWTGGPAATFGGAAGSPGCWNVVTGATGTVFNALLTGAACTPTGVSMTRSSALGGNFAFNNADTTGDDQFLMDDGQDLSDVPGALIVTFSGLQNGQYDVVVYSWAPDAPTADFTIVTIGGLAPQIVGGSFFSGAYTQGIHYARGTATVAGGQLTISADGDAATGSYGTLNGIQLRLITPAPVCRGDFSGDLQIRGNDIDMFIDAYLNPGSLTPEQFDKVDMNDSNTLDASDVSCFVSALLVTQDCNAMGPFVCP